ncbi:MAG: DUF2309 domain-containing protein [Candidatus Thiodiazotropha sp.]
MSPAMGQHLRIRAMIYVAGEPVPFFWPMRSFIHHNPLHGLEHLPFAEAVDKGAKLFHARPFLPRSQYQAYLSDARLDKAALISQLQSFACSREPLPGIDLASWALTLLQATEEPLIPLHMPPQPEQVYAALQGQPVNISTDALSSQVIPQLRSELLKGRPLYESLDALYGTSIGEELDELVIRACLDFFDEGQSVWVMPDRQEGFFNAWRKVAGGPVQALLKQIESSQPSPARGLIPEQVIDHVMRALEVPEEQWVDYFTREIVHLHGWSGYIRWRSNSSRYYWADRYPGDLVDLLAIRLTLAWMLIRQHANGQRPNTARAVEQLIESRPEETYLRSEFYTGQVLPSMVQRVDSCLSTGHAQAIQKTFHDYLHARQSDQAQRLAHALSELAGKSGQQDGFKRLDAAGLARLIQALTDLEAGEGMLWLRAMESRALDQLLDGISLDAAEPREKRPFVQAAFCIDTRSERIRRHLESVGDYQTYGIAGFFGVPVSLMELGKGSEMHLCPVLLTPKNLVLEMSSSVRTDEAAVTTLERAMHKLKESVLSPFVTVEAIGLLFGFDMIGKTVAPDIYNHWRKHLHTHKPNTHLLLDKLSREQADSIVRAVQRAVIVEAAEQELGMAPEAITDDMVKELREAALGNADWDPGLAADMNLDDAKLTKFVLRLRTAYRINTPFARMQLEQLARIGYSQEEQVGFVRQALSSIGLTEEFSRFVLLVGHGSSSENNPYESALDCGACGGNHGLVNARLLAQMANKASVRRRLAEHGIRIPDDAWFIPALHNTTTDEITLHDLELLPTSHLVYLDRLRNGLTSAARLCAQERLPSLQIDAARLDPASAFLAARRNSLDWSQVRPEWGLSRNAYFIIGRRSLSRSMALDGRAFLHSYDYRVDPKRRLLENILTGPLVVGQWINMEHYFSAVDNERFGSGSKVYHNVAGRFGVMTGNLSDLRTGLPAQTVLDKGRPYHEPLRLITVIEAPFEQAQAAIDSVVAVKRLVRNGWIRLVVIDPQTTRTHIYDEGEWVQRPALQNTQEALIAS